MVQLTKNRAPVKTTLTLRNKKGFGMWLSGRVLVWYTQGRASAHTHIYTYTQTERKKKRILNLHLETFEVFKNYSLGVFRKVRTGCYTCFKMG